MNRIGIEPMQKKDSSIFLGLGSNLGDRGANLQKALLLLEQWGIRVVRSSSLYETEPMGHLDQPFFLNMVVEIKTYISPQDLLMILHRIEKVLGRDRQAEKHWGSRSIDLDLLFYDGQIVDETDLHLPHPHLQERKFVLVPLHEIAASFLHPVLKKTIQQLLQDCVDTLEVKKWQMKSE